MNGPTTTEETNHISNILKHYKHAREKHPYFCDAVTGYTPTVAKFRLNQLRTLIEWRANNGAVTAEALARCELLEAEEAVLRGDIAHAVDECYDAIAVLLRTIDVLEGRQKLGKPTKGEKK